MKKGYGKTLEVEDMYNVCPEERSEVLGDKLEKYCIFLHSFLVVKYLSLFSKCQTFLAVKYLHSHNGTLFLQPKYLNYQTGITRSKIYSNLNMFATPFLRNYFGPL